MCEIQLAFSMLVTTGHAMTLFLTKPCFFNLDWSCDGMPLSWLAPTPTSQCNTFLNYWFQERTNVSEPHDKIIC
jgi:hypothetical protein